MTTIWLAALVLATPPALPSTAQPTAASAASDHSPTSAPAATPQQLRRRTSEILRREATTTGEENRAAIRDLLTLLGQLESDKDLAVDERQRLATTVRLRLERVAQRLSREIARAKAADRQGAQPQTVELADALRAVLAQQLQPLGQNMAQNPDPVRRGEALLELIKTTIRPETWDDQGGPGRAVMFPRFGFLLPSAPSQQDQINTEPLLAANDVRLAAGGAAEDDGQALVELIQQTIAPHSWDVVGGPGSIVYYRPLRVLVIRQTSEVHSGVGDVLGQVRRAGN